jgi:hypothetical protein
MPSPEKFQEIYSREMAVCYQDQPPLPSGNSGLNKKYSGGILFYVVGITGYPKSAN